MERSKINERVERIVVNLKKTVLTFKNIKYYTVITRQL